MKTMNIFKTLVILLFGFACSNPETIIDDQTSDVNLRHRSLIEEARFYEVNLHQYALNTELYEFEQLKVDYMRRIEEGDESARPLLDQTLINIDLANSYIDFYEENFKRPKGCLKKCPPPKPPNPCGDKSCPIVIPVQLEIWVEISKVDGVRIGATDNRGNPIEVQTETNRIEGIEDFARILVTIEEGEGIIEITKPFEPARSEVIKYLIPFQNM